MQLMPKPRYDSSVQTAKSKLICLPQHHQSATLPHPPDCDTSKEEQHIEDLLWERNGWMKRTDAIASLKENFESMQSPFMRTKCFSNAASRGKFFLSKGPYGQTVGLTKEDADAALAIAFPPVVDEHVSVVGECDASSQNTTAVLLKAEQKKPTSLLMEDNNYGEDGLPTLLNNLERSRERGTIGLYETRSVANSQESRDLHLLSRYHYSSH